MTLESPAAAPIAEVRPTTTTFHGDSRTDDYAWLRDRNDPAVTKYLEAENAYTEATMRPTLGLQTRLFEEFKARVQETDTSVPVRKDGFDYVSRTVEGLQYGIHARIRADDASRTEQILIDENIEAEDHEYFSLGAFDVSPNHGRLLWAYDTDGSELYTLRVRDLTTGVDEPDEIPEIYYGTAWAHDNATFFYSKTDDAMRPYQIWRHHLGTPVADDVLILEEPDEHFFAGVDLTKSEDFITISLHSSLTSEVWLLDAHDPTGEFRLVARRRPGVEYGVEHDPGDVASGRAPRLLIVTNDDAVNGRLVEAPIDQPDAAHWRDVVAHRVDVKLEGVEIFRRHLVLAEREAGNEQLRIVNLAEHTERMVEPPEAVCSIGLNANPEIDTELMRFDYTSLVTPASIFDEHLDTGERTLLKQQPVRAGYNPANYVTGRLWATAADGTLVPISYVHHRDFVPDGNAPALLYGYGSYEISIDPGFSALRVSLLDRGVLFAIAHVRGGGELGRLWYEHGKFLEKRNTFTDFIACAEHLIAEGYTSAARLAARGRSAGGLLMGAITNLRPDLFAAVSAEVPFVDSLNTMLDDTLPLTVGEWEEWGDPVHDAVFYQYMKSYAPYENVDAVAHPAILALGGLNDPRVSFWEPAKWIAKLRATTTGSKPMLLKTEMGAGHGGPTGRYAAWKDEAFVYAFLLQSLGISE
jgi:oligopeptidase B